MYTACSPQSLAAEAMATTFEVCVCHPDAAYARQAAAAALAELAVLEAHLSRFVENSDVARLSRLRAGQSSVVALQTLHCLEVAVEVQQWTFGAFDVAYGSELSEGDSPLFRRQCRAIKQTRTRGKRGQSPAPVRLQLDGGRASVRVLTSGTRLDLGGIGKGFALDHMAALLAEWEIDSALLSASTSTRLATGPPPGQSGWPVSFGPEGNRRCIQLAHGAFSGSGTAVRGSHIVDPRTGRPAARWFRAWAGAPTAAAADALSTAFMVMSRQEIRHLCRAHPDISAYVLAAGDASLRCASA